MDCCVYSQYCLFVILLEFLDLLILRRELFDKVGHSCLSPLLAGFWFTKVNPGL